MVPARPAATADWPSFWTALRRAWFLLPLLVAAAIAAVLWRASDDPDVYQSDAVVLVSPSDELGDVYQVVDALSLLKDRYVQGTFVDLLESPSLLTAVASDPDGPQLDRAARDEVVVAAELSQESYVVHISVAAPTPDSARELNEALVAEAVERFQTAYAPFAFTTLESATLPDHPLPSTAREDAVLAAAAAVVLWLLAALALARMRR